MERMKNFKDEVDRLVGEYIEELEEENKNLKEKIETLELRLDNKEKLNEEYRKKIDTKFKDGFDVLN